MIQAMISMKQFQRRGLGEGGAIVTCCSQSGCNWNRETAIGNIDINRCHDSSVTTFSELSKTPTIEFITLSQSPISADSSISLAGVGVGFAGSWPWVVLVMMLLVLALLILVVYFRSKFASVAIILRDFNKKHDQGEMGGRAKRSGSLSAWTLQVILTFMKVLRFFGDR